MNENIDLTKILKDCPEGTKLYSTAFGEVEFVHVEGLNNYPIAIITEGRYEYLTKEGKLFIDGDGECVLFPSREQRDWFKFTAPWDKKEKFDPKTLKAFDTVLVKPDDESCWCADIVSVPITERDNTISLLAYYNPSCIIPYNEDTKHLVGTNDEAPEYYRYWED